MRKFQEILAAIKVCPTAGNLQAYAVKVVNDKSEQDFLSRAAYGQDFIKQAPIVLIFFAVPEISAKKYGNRGIDLYCVQDATIAATYAQLAANDLGLASCWVGAFDEYGVNRQFGGDWSWRAVTILPIGYAASKNLTSPERFDRVMSV